MEHTMGNEGINKLAAVFQNRIHGMTDKPEVLDFGVIQGDMSLLTNRFPRPIPQTDYMVCRQLTLGPPHDTLTKTQDVGTHQHRVLIPEKMRQFKQGDRVLVCWVGDDACVIDLVLPATEVV